MSGTYTESEQQTALRAQIEAHPIFRYPKEERLYHREEWQQLFLLVMQLKNFLSKVEKRLASTNNVLMDDEAELEEARFSSSGKRRRKFDSVTFADALQTAVKNFDPALGKEFMAYFDAIYAQKINRSANAEAAARQESVQRLTKDEAAIWREFSRLCEKLNYDPRELSPKFYTRMADLMGVDEKQLQRLIRKCTTTRWITSLDAEWEDPDAPACQVADPQQGDMQDRLEHTAEVLRAITAIADYADLDRKEYPRYFFTNDVLAPMCADAPTVDPTSYCALLERSEDLLWQKIFAQNYIDFVFLPPPALDTLRHLLAAKRQRPLQDATIADCLHVTAAAISYQRKRYTAMLQKLAQAEDF